MTSEYEQHYSEQIKFSGWSVEWRLDEDDEDQLQANIEEAKNIVEFLERRKEIGTKGSAPKKQK